MGAGLHHLCLFGACRRREPPTPPPTPVAVVRQPSKPPVAGQRPPPPLGASVEVRDRSDTGAWRSGTVWAVEEYNNRAWVTVAPRPPTPFGSMSVIPWHPERVRLVR